MNSADREKKVEKEKPNTEYLGVSERIMQIQEREKKKLEEKARRSAATKVISTKRITNLKNQLREKIELHVFMALRQTGREELLTEDETQLCVDLIERLQETGFRQNNFIAQDPDQLPPTAIVQSIIDEPRAAPPPPPLTYMYNKLEERKIDDLRDLIIRLGGEFDDEFEGMICIIEKLFCLWEVNLESGSVRITSKENEERKASICIQWASWTRFQGYNNLGFAPFDLLILSKVVGIMFDQLPGSVLHQVKQFLETGRGASHVSPLYVSTVESTFVRPVTLHTALRTELAEAFQRIREDLTTETERTSRSQQRENDPPPPPPQIAAHNLRNEIAHVLGRRTPNYQRPPPPPPAQNSPAIQEACHAINRLLSKRQDSNQSTPSASSPPSFFMPPRPSVDLPPPPSPQSDDEAERQILRMLLAQLEARL